MLKKLWSLTRNLSRITMVKNLKSGFGIAILLFLSGCLLASHTYSWISWPHNSPTRLGLAICIISIVAWLVFRTSDISRPHATALGKPITTAPTAAEIAHEHMSLFARYDEAALSLFAEILTDLPHYLDRINESATVDSEAARLQLSTYLEFDLKHSHNRQKPSRDPSSLPSVLLIPFVWLARGTLLDQFSLVDSNGNHVSTLSYNESRGLLAYTLAFLFDMAIQDADDDTKDAKARWPWRLRPLDPAKRAISQASLVQRLVLAMCAPGPLSKQPLHEKERREFVLDALDVFPIDDLWRTRIKSFCRQYMDTYVIVAELPQPSAHHLGLTYTHYVPLESPTNYRLNQWRERFGLNPSTIDVTPNPFFLQVEAYHLEINPQSDQYVFDHHIEFLDTADPVRQGEFEKLTGKPYVRVYYEEGRPNAHLYIRPQRIDETPNFSRLSKIKSIVQFREVPPGALGGAAAVAFASAVIISFFALTRLGLHRNGRASPVASFPTDIPALLLALPGFVTVLLGSWIELSRLRRASLTTYLALVGTMCLSLMAALYYLYSSIRPVHGVFSLRTLSSHVVITTDAGWLILMIISVTHFLFLFRQVVSESKYYGRCVRHRALRQI